MALGVGVCAVRSDKQAGGDSFGLVALCSIGPIITVLILGLLYKPDGNAYTAAVMPDAKDTVEMFDLYLSEIPHYLKETASALLPIGAFLILFQLVTRRLKRKEILHMVIGLVYVYIGLTIFLMGVNVGFMPWAAFWAAASPAIPIIGYLSPLLWSSVISSYRRSRLSMC